MMQKMDERMLKTEERTMKMETELIRWKYL